MESKKPIVMIILVFILFCGQLTAEEVVGVSIFPCIETPHPYPKAVESNTLVWSETIHEPGAAWIKIHFSKFRLNPGDYVELVDMNGKVIERIKGKYVVSKRRSKFHVKNSGNKTVSFWGPAIDGDKVVVELYRKSNKKKDWGFTIDEVGVGSKPVLDGGPGPIYNTKNEKKMFNEPFYDGRPQIIRLGVRKNDVDVLNSPLGKMLYRKGATWFTGKGALRGVTGNHFLPAEASIDYQDVLDTLQVRFFVEYTTRENVSTFPGYYTYYGGSIAVGGSKSDIGYIKLRNDDKMIYIEPIGKGPNKKVPLPNLFVTADDYWASETVHDQDTIDEWEESTFEPPLDETEDVPSDEEKVLDIMFYVNDELDNWYEGEIRMNTEGELAKASLDEVSPPSSSQAAPAAGISRPSYYFPWYPRCCGLQYLFCRIFKRIFWWRYINCYPWYLQCWYYNYYYYYYGYYDPCYRFGKWGLTWLLYIWFSYYW